MYFAVLRVKVANINQSKCDKKYLDKKGDRRIKFIGVRLRM